MGFVGREREQRKRERERESWARRRREEIGEFFFIIRIVKGMATLGNTVDTHTLWY
jgi:hypothetical protein